MTLSEFFRSDNPVVREQARVLHTASRLDVVGVARHLHRAGGKVGDPLPDVADAVQHDPNRRIAISVQPVPGWRHRDGKAAS